MSVDILFIFLCSQVEIYHPKIPNFLFLVLLCNVTVDISYSDAAASEGRAGSPQIAFLFSTYVVVILKTQNVRVISDYCVLT